MCKQMYSKKNFRHIPPYPAAGKDIPLPVDGVLLTIFTHENMLRVPNAYNQKLH